MKVIAYSSFVGNLLYAQVCTLLEIAFVVGVLKVIRYLQGIKDLMLTYHRTNIIGLLSFCDVNYAGCMVDKNPPRVICRRRCFLEM